jgi:hypothetical protein
MPTPQDKLAARRRAARATPSDLGPKAVKHISGALNVLLADVFALYLKNKNFHRHMSAPHFRDFRLLLDEHGDQIFAMTDAIAERLHDPLDRPRCSLATSWRQRRAVCRPVRHARRIARRQPYVACQYARSS